MAVRYIYNTSGHYVAFVQNGNLFSPNGQWLGVVKSGNEVYAKDGRQIGFVTADDRIVRDTRPGTAKRTERPIRPLTPTRPLTPLKRLRMPRVPHPYEDVFEAKTLSAISNSTHDDVMATHTNFDFLIGASIFAHDNTFLGLVSQNVYDNDSIANQYGPHGSPYSATSIFNQYCPYGSQYSSLSPFNPYTTTPPRIMKDGQLLGYLSKNPYLGNRIDVDQFMDWLRK